MVGIGRDYGMGYDIIQSLKMDLVGVPQLAQTSLPCT